MRSELSLELRPDSGVRRLDGPDTWRAELAPISFDLDPGTHGFPDGWVLLTARLSRSILDGSSRLSAETENGDVVIEVPVSTTGTVHELVRLPPRIRRLFWQPSHTIGTFQHTPLSVRSVGLAERCWLMIRRVASMLWAQPAERKKSVGLAWWKPWIDLPGQYRACGKLRMYILVPAYREWLERHDRLSATDRRRIRQRISRMRARPRFALVVCPGHGEGDEMARTVQSLEAQLYRHYSVVFASPQDAQPPEIPGSADYVAVLQAGDRLAEHALYWIAEVVIAGDDVAVAYADEDVIDRDGVRGDPKFKPDWSPEHLRSINYIGRWAVFRARELAAAGGLRSRTLRGDGHLLNLRVTRRLRRDQVAHVPAILFHRFAANPAATPRRRPRLPLPGKQPLVSIIIPTRDAQELLRGCVESILRRSSYPAFEILIVDNQSSDPAALAYLRDLGSTSGVRVLRYDRAFNYSAINNYAVRAARGEAVVLLNNDTEVISADWLEEMLGHLHRDGVGAVGAKLLFADGRVQHAGDGVGPGGCADHLHIGIERDSPGYCYRALVAQEVSAVTGACLMTWKRLYRDLGGLDERRLPVSFNDVDYCLRLQDEGWRVIFTPHAELRHHESATRGRHMSVEQQARALREVRYMRRRWRARLRHDPYYNPNLNYDRPDFSLGYASRVVKPWLT